jgi:hypothetical protein
MTTIAHTSTRPARADGRLVLEVEFEGGVTHVLEVNAAPFYASLAAVLREPGTRKVAIREPGDEQQPEVASPS